MIKDIIGFLIKLSVQCVVWVFLLSFSWGGETLFQRAHGILVENELVKTIHEKASVVWDNIYTSVYDSFKSKVTKEIK